MGRDRQVGLDTQPLFAPSVLLELAAAPAPPAALAAPALAAAAAARAAAVPFEGVQEIQQLATAAFLLSACHLVRAGRGGVDGRGRPWVGPRPPPLAVRTSTWIEKQRCY